MGRQRQHDYLCKCFTKHTLTYFPGEHIPRSTPQRREGAATVCASLFTQAMIRRVPQARCLGIERRHHARGHDVCILTLLLVTMASVTNLQAKKGRPWRVPDA